MRRGVSRRGAGAAVLLIAGASMLQAGTVGDEWPTNGGDSFNRRYSPLTQIDRHTVSQLKARWRVHLGGSGMGAQYSGEAQPIVVDSTLYLSTGANDVFAIDIDSGDIRWTYQAHLSAAIDALCCGWASRGVAIGEGRVYSGQVDGKLLALDQRTGSLLWSIQAERSELGYSITSAPLYYQGLVIVGFAGAEFGTRGRVKAFSAKDGSLVWTFYTVPGPGDFGSASWPRNSDAWQHGGGSVWQTPAVDPQLGLVYFATGNPGPDFDGSVRAGDNLFTSSIIALDLRTGQYRWHFQEVHHDLWDFDAANPVVLFDLAIRGKMRRALAQAGKTGWVYVLDRTTGKPLNGISERSVAQEPRQATSRTQPVPVGDAFVPQSVSIAPEGFKLRNGGRIFTPYWTEPIVANPGHNGGANWPPSSYDIGTGYLYVCANDRTGIFTGGRAARPAAGGRYLGGQFGNIPHSTSGIFAALDMRTNRLVWQQQWPERCYSGSLVTAGGLVFVGRSDGRFTALDSSDGALLWEFQTGAGVNAPPATFSRNGEQYVVVYSAGNVFAGSPHGDSVWLFSLHGTLGPTPPAAVSGSVAQSATTTRPATVAGAAPDLQTGRSIFASACAPCHGPDGLGGQNGPSLAASTDLAIVMRTVGAGRGQMPSFAGVLNPESIRDVSTHVTQNVPH
jgi:quinohemoprotein ethanol dehydrogenase